MSEQTAPDPRDVRNAGKEWTENELNRLRNLAVGSTPLRLIIRELGRPEEELRAKAEELGVNLETAGYNRLSMHEQ